jgi:uncharacterized integral membrane protein
MRLLAFLFLVALVIAVAIFAYQNNDNVSLDFLSWHGTASMALVVGAAFVTGMLGGWSLLGAVRRSVHRFTER